MSGSGVSTQHIDYTYHLEDWTKIRDVLAGERKVKAKGETYLPRLSSREGARADKAYAGYLSRARLFGASKRTLKGWIGSIFRKPAHLSGLDAIPEILKNIDLAGCPLPTFCKDVAQETLTTGRAGVLVDRQEATTGRAYLVAYKAEEILNWDTEVIDGARVVTLVVLKHVTSTRGADGFSSEPCFEYRVLALVEGVYQLAVYRDMEGKGEYSMDPASVRIPTMRGKPFRYIPFVFFGPSRSSSSAPEIEESPLLDLVTLNLHHYKRTADLTHGLHFVALPTFCTIGDDDDDPIELGPGTVQNFKNPNVKLEIWESKGTGLNLVRQDLQDLKEEMASVGAAMVTAPKRDAETVEALTLKNAQQNSPLAAVAESVEEGLSEAMRILATWEGLSAEGVAVRLNKDFDKTRLSASDLKMLSDVLIAGGITAEVYAELLATAEILPPEVKAKAFALELEREKEAKAQAAADAAEAAQAKLDAQPKETPVPDHKPRYTPGL